MRRVVRIGLRLDSLANQNRARPESAARDETREASRGLQDPSRIVLEYFPERIIVSDSKCSGEFFVKVILESKNCKWVKNPKNDVLEIALDQ